MTKRTVWRYQLRVAGTQKVLIPGGAEILTAQMQGENMCLWALVNPDAPNQWREIEVCGTGHPMPEAKRRHISTIQTRGVPLVYHVFERE